MPYVNIKVTKENLTPEKKAELIKGATQLLVVLCTWKKSKYHCSRY